MSKEGRRFLLANKLGAASADGLPAKSPQDVTCQETGSTPSYPAASVQS